MTGAKKKILDWPALGPNDMLSWNQESLAVLCGDYLESVLKYKQS